MPTPLKQSTPPLTEVTFGSANKGLKYLDLISLKISHSVNRIAKATVVFIAPNSALADLKDQEQDVAACRPGTKAQIKVTGTAATGKASEVLFAGVVTKQVCSLSREGAVLTLTLKHPLQSLTASHRSQLFEKKSDQDVVRAILKEHSVNLTAVAGMTVKHPQLIQLSCSDWQFINARVHANGVWLIPTPKGAEIIEPKLAAKADYTINAKDSGNHTELLSIGEWVFDSEQQAKKIEIAAWDVGKQAMSRTIDAQAIALGTGGLDVKQLDVLNKQTWELHYSMPLPSEEQTALAKSRWLAQHMQGIQARFTVVGSTAFALGKTLSMTGFGKHLDGSGIVTEVYHYMDKGVWSTTLTLGQSNLREVDIAPLPTISGLHIGVVDKYEKDPDNLDRLRVRIPALNLKDKAVWARFSTGYASKEKGLCLYPETGDEIVLGFFDKDPRYPVILGSMYNPKNKAPYPPSEENQQKGLVFKKGEQTYQLLFDTKEGSATLQSDKDELVMKKGITLKTEQDAVLNAKNAKLKTEQDTTLNAKNVMLKAEQDTTLNAKNMTLKTGQDTTLNAKNVTLKADLDATLNAKNVTLKTDLDTTLKAKNITLQADLKLDAQGRQSVTIKGMSIDLGP